MFEVDYRVIKTINGLPKKQIHAIDYLQMSDKQEVLKVTDFCFGEFGFNFPIFSVFCNFFIYEKKKFILPNIFNIFKSKCNSNMLLVRQGLINFIYFEIF